MGRKVENLAGQKFGRLTVVELAGRDKSGKAKWLCQCECGGQKVIYGSSLKKGLTKSCGCLQREKRKVWTDAGRRCRKKGTLCTRCIRSAAPPELQCVWDASKGQQLPTGAEIDAGDKRVRVTSCPEYLSINDAANATLLWEARRRNDKRITKEFTERYISC